MTCRLQQPSPNVYQTTTMLVFPPEDAGRGLPFKTSLLARWLRALLQWVYPTEEEGAIALEELGARSPIVRCPERRCRASTL